MGKICYEQALVEEAVALQAYALPSGAAKIVCVVRINANVCFVVHDTGETHRSGLVLADVLSKTIGETRIGLLLRTTVSDGSLSLMDCTYIDKFEIVKETGAAVVPLHLVSSDGRRGERQRSEKSGSMHLESNNRRK